MLKTKSFNVKLDIINSGIVTDRKFIDEHYKNSWIILGGSKTNDVYELAIKTKLIQEGKAKVLAVGYHLQKILSTTYKLMLEGKAQPVLLQFELGRNPDSGKPVWIGKMILEKVWR